MLKRAFVILEPLFTEYVIPESGDGLLDSPERWNDLLADLPASQVRENLERKWASDSSTPEVKWAQLKQHIAVLTKKGSATKSSKTMSNADRIKLETWPMEVVFRYTYPRLDINVSKMQNHLLKSPFCVHPKTGRVCVPIDAERIDEFDPFTVPTLPQLMEELDQYDSKEKVQREWLKTSLKESFSFFQKKFLDPLLKDLRRARRDAQEQVAAIHGDF
mmetsp:Transcript_9190/g.21156  ORF Transcript_9190/g.21156 Transcript_9190/m.21156 type:complete len:218 (+) Transcript_9190:140-793(+)